MRIAPSRAWTAGLSSRFVSVPSRTLFRASIVVAALWLVASVAALSAIRWESTWQMDTATTNIAVLVAQDLEHSIALIGAALNRMADVLRGSDMESLTPAQRKQMLFAATAKLPGIEFLQVLNEKGDVIDSLLPSEHENWALTDYFSKHRRDADSELLISKPFAVKKPDSAGIPISRRLAHPDESFAGVVVYGLKLSYVRDLFDRLKLGTHGTISLLFADGTVLARLPPAANTTGQTLNSSDPLTRAVQAGEGEMPLDDPIDGVRRQFAFTRVGTLPLVVAVGLAPADVQAGFWVAAMAVMGTGALVVLLAVATALRMAQESRRREAAEHQTEEKVRFLATVSHELRSPLHGLLGCAEQLRSAADLPSLHARNLDAVVKRGRQLRDTVDHLLDFWRFEARGPALKMRQIDLPDLLRDCCAIAEPEARTKGLELHYIPAPDAPRRFVADATLLRQVVVNLLLNAVKFTRHGEVELRYNGNADRVQIEVADTGPGIRPDQRQKLFHDFERLGADEMGIKGTGLGLSISDRLTRRMGGQIGYRENTGGGSVFWVDLPAGVEQEPATPNDETAAPAPLRILVVDNSESHRDLATAYLTGAGHSVVEAADGDAGVRLADAEDFDVIVMDMRMRDISGLDATRKIRALQGRRRAVPIIAVSADALDTDLEECQRLRLLDHLSKPFTEAELLAAIAKARHRYAETPEAAFPRRAVEDETPPLVP